jgi:4-hydroxymandelate oxidase
MSLATVAQFEARAREVLPRETFHTLFGSSTNAVGTTSRDNVLGFREILLRPRVLVDVSTKNTRTTVMGQSIAMPIMVAPVGGLRRFHPDGELAAARAASAAETVMTLSTGSSFAIEDVAKATSGPLWFQLYVLRDKALTQNLVKRAQDAGCRCLLVTVDNSGGGMTSSLRERAGMYISDDANINSGNFASLMESSPATKWWEMKSDAFSWSELAWLRSITSMPLIVKGIQTAEDAELCVEHEVDGIVVSNHGGHALPNASATIHLLAPIVRAVDDRLETFIDGGIRHGADVLKALALGARAVFIGRPMVWALASTGQQGVARVLQTLNDELVEAMGLCGITDVTRVEDTLVTTRGSGATY